MPASTESKRRRHIFNLLKPQVSPPTAWDKIYEWLVKRARVVIVVCELMVALLFITKVIVDLEGQHLQESLAEQAVVLDQYFGTVEPKLRDIQQKSRTYTKLWEKSTSYAAVLAEVQSYIVNPAAKIDVLITGEKVTLRGSESLAILRGIEEQMKASTTFSNARLELDTESGVGEDVQGKYVIYADIATSANRGKLDS